MSEKASEWKTVSIRQELIKEIENAIRTGRYRSISEFVSEAIRLRLEELSRSGGVQAGKKADIVTPEKVLFTAKHTWAQEMPDGNIRVGVSDYAEKQLKGLASIKVNSIGSDIEKMKPLGVAETWMFMFDISSPVSGKVVKINERLRDAPSMVKEDPYGKGWIAEIRPRNTVILEQELNEMLSARDYAKLVSKLEGS